jgi:aminoglycoside phosphotransferase (APT) family kinase protein
VLIDALEACRASLPADEPAPSVCWGDVRLPNVIFDDECTPAAVLDWEMATLAPPEVDLGWFLTVHRMSVEVVGSDLPGFRPRAEMLSYYEQQLGRPLHDLHWYEAWGALRSAAIMVRLARLLFDLGFVADLRMRERNPSIKLLRTLLSL